jgi:Co/Zn/Cd efflux system component
MIQHTRFHIAKMDCPSEEQLIRMKVEGMSAIQSMEFDIPNRQLSVYHTGSWEPILQQIGSLQLGATMLESGPSEATVAQSSSGLERRLLMQVLGINLFFFALEMLTGFLSGSMGLMADGLDMLADAIVYGMALFVVGAVAAKKKRIAAISGYFQLALAFLGMAEVIRRFLLPEPMPGFWTMIIVSVLALAGNALCLYLLQKSNSREVHMQASLIFTSNDVIANLGVIVAGILVYFTASKYPDLLIGFVVFILVGRGALRILRISKKD